MTRATRSLPRSSSIRAAGSGERRKARTPQAPSACDRSRRVTRLPQEMIDKIEGWAVLKKLRGRSAALRDLIERGLRS